MMKIEFANNDGGDVFHFIEKENPYEFINMLKSLDKIHVFIEDDYFLFGTIEDTIYEVRYDTNEPPEEKIIIYIGDLRE